MTINSELYLSRISISEFRPFGPEFSLDVPGPGLTVLVGPNGLGKTAFFEAIEWALTGQVERLQRLDPKHAAYGRIQAGRSTAFNCTVSLEFGSSEVAVVRRGRCSAKGELIGEPHLQVLGANDAVTLLRSSLWRGPIEASTLSSYLRTTHLLAQSSAVRLTSQDPKERWTALSQLNGAALLERAQHRLLSRATTTALDDAIASAQTALAARQERLERWLGLVETRDAAAQEAAVEGALAPDAIGKEIALLVPSTSAEQIDIEAAISSARALLEQGNRARIERVAELEGLTKAANGFSALAARRASELALLATAEATLAETR